MKLKENELKEILSRKKLDMKKENVNGAASGRVCAGTKCAHGVGYDGLRASENWNSDDSVKPKDIADMWAAKTKAQDACSQVHSPEMTVKFLFNAEPGVG